MEKLKISVALFLLQMMTFSAATTCTVIHVIQNAPEAQTLPEREVFVVTATMYQPTQGQTDDSPNITADGSKIDPEHASDHKWIAVSRNLLKRWGGPLDYGDKVIIEGAQDKDGVYEIHDTMNKRCKNQIDILESADARLYKYKNVKIYKA